jgi:hypothetical protein
MRLRTHRRNLVVWHSCIGPADRYDGPRLIRPVRARRIRRFIRSGALLTVIGLVRLARAVRPRWRPLLAGGALTAVGFALRGGAGGVVVVPGLLLLLSVPLIPASPEEELERRCELEHELAAYSTPAQRCDLEATLDRYPDSATYELREILAGQVMAHGDSGIPGSGRH